MIKQENYSRRENILIHGTQPEDKEDCLETVYRIFAKMNLDRLKLSRCHRLQHGKRPIIARFAYYSDKTTVMKNRHLLKGSGIFISDDVAHQTAVDREAIVPVYKYMKHVNIKATLVNDKLKFDGKLYGLDTVSELPIDLDSVGVTVENTKVAFAGEFTSLSNLHPCGLYIGEQHYNSTEQFYQQQKCLSLDQPSVAREVMRAATPREAMIAGKAARTTDDWIAENGTDIMRTALNAKFQQVPQFKKALLEHKGKEFIEYSRHSGWGIGHPFSYRSIPKVTDWKGKNYMGQLLTELANTS